MDRIVLEKLDTLHVYSINMTRKIYFFDNEITALSVELNFRRNK